MAETVPDPRRAPGGKERTNMTICFVRWKDACQVEANSADPVPAIPQLSELCEVGFLLAENEEALLIGLEYQADDTLPGRWRFNIPKAGIVERHDFIVEKLVAPKKVRAGKKSAVHNVKNEATRKLLQSISTCQQQGGSEAGSIDPPTAA